MKKVLRILLGPIGFTGLLIALQALTLIVVIAWFQQYFVYFYAFCIILSIIVVMTIVNNRLNPAYKIAWIIPIMALPIFGGLFYLLFGSEHLRKQFLSEMQPILKKMNWHLQQDEQVFKTLEQTDLRAANQSAYMSNYAMCPVYQQTTSEYLSIGEEKFERLIKELKEAKHYIFLEYFIIEEGVMWNTILDILKEKAAAGVDVRVIYDGFGCLFTLPTDYPQ